MKTHAPKLALWSLAAVALAVGALGVDQAPQQASATEYLPFTITVDKVIVSQFGGIQVEGTLDCTEAVVSVYGSELTGAPDMVLTSPNWDAYQYVGRTGVVHAAYESGIARPCYIKDEPGPYRWYTVTPFPDSHLTWVFSDAGKFSSGRIHIEAFAVGGWEVRWEDPEPSMVANLEAWGQADLKAGKAPKER